MSFLKPTPATSSSVNTNNGLLTSTYGGMMNSGVGANNYLSSLLMGGGAGGGGGGSGGTPGTSFDYRHDGIKGNAAAARAAGQPDHGMTPGTAGSGGAGGAGGDGGAQAGLEGYYKNAGFEPAMRQLSQNITGQGAASGILNSGTTAKALQSRGTELNQQYFNNYLQQLAGLSGLGLQAGGLVANAGQKSQSSGGGPSTAGTIASLAGGIASVFSDRRLKRDIELVGREADGLGVYLCRYVWSRTRRLMVMADEVAKFRPWALGPVRVGFATVNYGAL